MYRPSSPTTRAYRSRRFVGAVALVVLAVSGVVVFRMTMSSPTADPAPISEQDSPAADRGGLGRPIASLHPPAVVPRSAVRNDSLSGDNFTSYLMPAGVQKADVQAWYRQHMPPGSDFGSLTWLETLPPDELFSDPDWYWCSDTAQSIDITVGQDDPADGGRTFISIAEQTVSDGACG